MQAPSRAHALLAALATFACLGGALAFPSTARAASSFVKGPFLHDLGTDRVTVRVEVDPPAPVSVELAGPVAGDAGAPIRVADNDLRAFHDITIKGLEAAQPYRYTVRSGKAEQAGTFTTAPKPSADARFSFLLYGDNRSDPVAHAAIVRAMLPAPGDFLVHTGDFVEDGRDASMWQSFFDIERDLLRDRCVFSCVGNHELIESGGDNYLRYLGPSLAPGEAPKLYGTFRWGSARFFLLDGQEQFSGAAEGSWLEQALTAAENEPDLLWRFVVVHFGYRSAGPHGDNPRMLAAHHDELFRKKKVDLVISGHDHEYERGDQKGVRYVVSGGGGAPLYRPRALPSTHKLEATYHYVTFDVSPAKVTLVAKRVDGSLLDTCSFGRAPGWDCEPKVPDNAPAPPLKDDSFPAASPGSSAAGPPPPPKCGCAARGPSANAVAPVVTLAAIALLALRRRLRYSRR